MNAAQIGKSNVAPAIIGGAARPSAGMSHPAPDAVWFLSGATSGGESAKHCPIDEQPFVVGRQSGVALKLDYRTVSSQHAELSLEAGQLILCDLGSTNGTYINGKKLTGMAVLQPEDLVHFAEAPFRVRRQNRMPITTGTIAENVCDQALALVQFDRLMNQRLVRPHIQPIVRMSEETLIGFEILGRGSVFGLESVGAMFQAAEQLELEVELSRLLRWEGLRMTRDHDAMPKLFVNTHPKEMLDLDALLQSVTEVRDLAPGASIVLEIHEAAAADAASMRRIQKELHAIGIELAYDDFGAGQARLAELIEARPDYVKFDISLIRGLDAADASRRRMIEALVRMVRELDIAALAEGIETAAEAAVCREIGFDLAQGFHYGRPAPV